MPILSVFLIILLCNNGNTSSQNYLVKSYIVMLLWGIQAYGVVRQLRCLQPAQWRALSVKEGTCKNLHYFYPCIRTDSDHIYAGM